MNNKIPENFHAMYDTGFRAAHGIPMRTSPQATGINRLSAVVPDIVVSYDEATQLPNSVVIHQPTARLSTLSAPSPEAAVTQFIQDRGDLWNLTSADIATVEVVSVSRKGLNTVNLIQRVAQKEVFNSEVTVALTSNQEVLSLSGQLFPGTSAARSRAVAATTISAVEAIAKAAFDLTSVVYLATDFSPAENPGNETDYSFYQFIPQNNDSRPAFERPIRVKEVMFPLSEGQFIPSYYIELWIKGFPTFSYVMDAIDSPDLLFRKNLTSSISFKYHVHNTGDPVFRPEDGPAPGTPHPTGLPDGFQAPTIPEKLIDIESLLPGDPWLLPGATTTKGNNCIAYADLTFPDGQNAGDEFGQITSPGVFDYTYDHNQPAKAPQNLQSSLVGMFFHVNWLHDRWYEAGFDEASGNAQQDNYGRGGKSGDPILAEGNDFSGNDNANMSTPADGDSPRMQMYEFLGPSPLPSRTSNFEALITFHEMGHYITNRLIGNASGLTNIQGEAMGEGWGDFFAICMTSQRTDNFANGVFAVGGWTDVTQSFRNNYYFSIRRYPYSSDMAKNPLTFKHISNNVVLPAGPPLQPSGGPNNEVHNAGEVWCITLWEVFVNLVTKHGHQEAEQRMLKYVIGGLKLTPARPTFIQARDGIIAAVSALDASDLPPVWAGFAKRGMGVGAVSPPSSSNSLVGVVESFAT
jgi:extracellular elastinolytic metalloproteinase